MTREIEASFEAEWIDELRKEGIIADGMIPKLTNSFKAIESGVEKVIIKHASDLPADTGTILIR